jgi:hypothetical protein
MAGDEATVLPLRASDPAVIGAYRLLGRLGEGGMGTVYLAMGEAGRMVALKMIRVDRAGDEEFRRRFRGEVKRARQVPPFCTAEVIDADPDHDPPYLVVEYVDGPSLAAVVDERGPLTAANLHGLAIGVATALTAIHGAGVIHRDLKPTNVLLPPGSPKVIDFGIARALQGTDMGTSTGTVIGTVSYMAPERFDAATGGTLTAAADVFAWGAVVAYAGTGRTPFGGDSPEVTAVRIMTQPPDLDGLASPLRDLVEQALAKDPAARPTARELLDELLAGGARRPQVLAAAFAGQPELLVAAEKAQAATDHHALAETALAAAGDTTSVAPTVVVPGATQRVPVQRTSGPDDVPRGTPPRPPVERWHRMTTTLLALVVLVGAIAGLGYLSGVLPLDQGGGAGAVGSPTPSTPPSATSSGSGANATQAPPRVFRERLRDPLTAPYHWTAKNETADGHGKCLFDESLVVTSPNNDSYRCQGPRDSFMDARVEVDVTVLAPDSCAAIWFRFTLAGGGYAARVCPAGVNVVTHAVPGMRDVESLRRFRYDGDRVLEVGDTVRVGIEFFADDLRVRVDGRQIGAMPLSTLLPDTAAVPLTGRVLLGIFPFSDEGTAPFSVGFADVAIDVPA